jgi:DNA-directed RNA polymerase specialized sigma24 family protein
MQSEASTQSDSDLLESWCQQRSESAFAELVRRYERLVTGAAMRRAGDLEVARDITQQVFAMLAAKARLLVGRTNIAGWLYRAANHMAAQLRRSDARRLARHTAAANRGPDATDDHWGILEEALRN